ncbi:hypothetical protein D9601_05480 [Sphingomonas sp. MA1305]|uniref:squalene/phytoene synthase family protein n=1 Tax=Sphingomonas sp. MA1305 TaxID=2479204 RepID=UPI0018DF8FAD|nr:squalene/phytoene synthase family protein [Sphingomonas sp. MA1305]MBI0474811.1 hypothetical protein [Sphingomonas sp. MA1305]
MDSIVEDLTPDREIAVASAAPTDRGGLAALLALDQRFGAIVRAARDPMIGQMRLTWWHDALARLDQAPPPAEPLLQALAAEVLPHGVTGAELAMLVEGWEMLLEGMPDDPAGFDAYAAARGGALFALAGRVLGADAEALRTAGQGWALADLASHSSDDALAGEIRRHADDLLQRAFANRWDAARAVGILALLARLALGDRSPLAKSLIVVRFRMTGR